jgi:large subunit ribosomal protein L46
MMTRTVLRCSVGRSITTQNYSLYKTLCATTAITRSFASTTSAQQSDPDNTGWIAQKKQLKDARRLKYEHRQAKLRNAAKRRSSINKGDKKREFRDYFDKKRIDEEYMTRKARQAHLQWKLQLSVIVQRSNIVLPDKADWEVAYENLDTYLSQFGKLMPDRFYSDGHPNDANYLVTDEELFTLLPKGYTPAPRETEADHTGNVRTLDRKLKTSVYLYAQDAESGKWQFPTVDLDPHTDTFVEAAQRCLEQSVGAELEVWIGTNAPCAVDLTPYEDTSDGYYGSKTFYYLCGHDEGDVSAEQMTFKDYAWLDRTEIVERVQNEQGEYMAKFHKYLLPEFP